MASPRRAPRRRLRARSSSNGMAVMRMNVLAPILFVVMAHGAAAAQEGRGTITGRLTDETGAVIAGVEVHVTNRETGATAGARSNDTGNYTIPYLLPGL